MKTLFWCLGALFVLFFFSLPASADDTRDCRQSLNEWNSCSRDEDCVIIPDICGSMIGTTSSAHLQDATDCNLKLRAVSSCSVIEKPENFPPMKAICERGFCKARPVTQ